MIDRPQGFHQLDINDVLDAAETAMGLRFSNLCRGLNSYINRVYELQPEVGDPVIIKFYRPGRWSLAALQEEHIFLQELEEAEVPVIAPWADGDARTLFDAEGIPFALFPKRGGLLLEEPREDQWQELGRLLARMHSVGQEQDAEHRITMTPDESMRAHVEHILSFDDLPPEVRSPYQQVLHETLDFIIPLFEECELQRIHGDLHYQNIIYRPNEGLVLIDFDDMAIGPAVQDIWMLLPGRVQDCVAELDAFIEGYENFLDFDTRSLHLVEALRCMRFVHYVSWCVHQAEDGGHRKLGQDWGTPSYWRREVQEMSTQLQEARDALDKPSLF